MNMPLFKMFIKKNWMILAGFTLFFLFELLACVFLMEMIDGMGFLGIGGGEEKVMSTGEKTIFYMSTVMPLLGYMFPMVFYIFIVYRIIFRPIDTTSLSPVLASGVKRKEYIATAAMFLIVSLVVMFSTIFVVCGISMLYLGSFDWGKWAFMCYSVALSTTAVAFISFFFASAFAPGNLSKLGMIGLPILFLVIFMAGVQAESEILMKLVPFGWKDLTDLAFGFPKLWWLWDIIFLSIISILITASIVLFKRKQLSI